MTVDESLQCIRSGQFCRMKTSRLRADVRVELELGEVGLVDIGRNDALSSPPLVKDEQS